MFIEATHRQPQKTWAQCAAWKAPGRTNQRASSPFRSEGLSGLGWGSESPWWSVLCSDSWSRSWCRCESSLWPPCRTSSSFSRMSFSVSLSTTPGAAGIGKSVPLSLVSLLRRCRVQHLMLKGGKHFQNIHSDSCYFQLWPFVAPLPDGVYRLNILQLQYH